MAVSKWVYQLNETQALGVNGVGLFIYGGFYEPRSPVQTPEGFDDWTHHGIAEFPDADPNPDPRTERYDAGSPTLKRPATDMEWAAYDEAKDAHELDLEIMGVPPWLDPLIYAVSNATLAGMMWKPSGYAPDEIKMRMHAANEMLGPMMRRQPVIPPPTPK